MPESISAPIDLSELNLKPQALGKGGEGNVYEFSNDSPWRFYVAKLYHSSERNAQREKKLLYMIAHPPEVSDPYTLIWPERMIYEKGEFAGFLMKKARGDFDLTVLSSLRLSRNLPEEWFQQYSRQKALGMKNRAKIAWNLAFAVHQLHLSQQYVLVDFKPENIKIRLDGQVSLIDMDSVEVIQEGVVLFNASKLSPEYSPPEIKKLQPQQEYVAPTWDYFSLAVVLYKLLLGLHPFAGTGAGEYQRWVTLKDKIAAGLFPHGRKRGDLAVIPAPHQNFYSLPKGVQRSFIQTFDVGLEEASQRSTAEDWYKQLQNFTFKKPGYALVEASPKPQNASAHLELGKRVVSWGQTRKWLGWIFIMNLFFQELIEIFIPTGISFYAILLAAPLLFVRTFKEFDLDEENKRLVIYKKDLFGTPRTQKVDFHRVYCDNQEKDRFNRIRFYKKVGRNGRRLLFQIRFKKDSEGQIRYEKLVNRLFRLKLLMRVVMI